MEDCYTYYVLIMGLPENLFWYSELSDLISIAADKAAYDDWVASERDRLAQERKNRR